MRGHIRKRGDRSWAIVLDLGRDHTDKRRQKWHTVHGTKKDAERELNRLLHDLNTGGYVEPAKLTVKEYLDKWLADYARHNTAPKTYERYEDIINQHIGPAIGATALSKLTPLKIQSFYSEAMTSGRKDGKGGLAAQTVLHFHRILHKALDQAVKWQLLARNPADAVEAPRPVREEMRAIGPDDVAKLLRKVEGTRLHLPVLLAVTLGLRRGEILGLRWSDLDLDGARATVCQSLMQTRDGLSFKQPKTAKGRRSVTVPTFTIEALRAHKAKQNELKLQLGRDYNPHGLVCAREDGEPWPPDTFSTVFAARIRSANLPKVRFHDLRHTHATQLLRQGVHPKIVSERLGHANIAITMDTYSHVMPDMQEGAAQAIDQSLRLAMGELDKT